MNNTNKYEQCFSQMMRHDWKIDDVLPVDAKLNLSKMLIPSALTHHHLLAKKLPESQLRTINHITAKSYLNFFRFVEEFIIIKTKQVSKAKLKGTVEQKAFSRFYQEEIKHQKLLERAMGYIDSDLNPPPLIVGFKQEAAEDILQLHPIAVLLLIYHLEIITQEHYVQSVKSSNEVCDHIKSILQSHWIEEAQHAKLDLLEIQSMCQEMSAIIQHTVIDDYFKALSQMIDVFEVQAGLDLQSLNRLSDNSLSSKLEFEIKKTQHDSYINLFILTGLEHNSVKTLIQEIFSAAGESFRMKSEEIKKKIGKSIF